MMIFRFCFILIGTCFLTSISTAQSIDDARKHVNRLSANEMFGRGYVKGGDKKAAIYIKQHLESYGLKYWNKNYFQTFSFPMNTFPGAMQVEIDHKNLAPVSEFVVAPECNSMKGSFKLTSLPKAADSVDAIYDSIVKVDYGKQFVIADFPNRKIRHEKPFNAAGIIIPKQKLYWWASTGHVESEIPVLLIKDSILQNSPEILTINIKNKFKKKHTTQNVIGFIQGKQQSDSFLVFTAHYDHLGLMGKNNVFKGANDNASGTAMLLWLAHYFSKPENQPDISIAFLFFAAEESGLIGSGYFVDNPTFPLKNIKALINLDMVGSGSEGIAIVNGKANKSITDSIISLNNSHSYFTDIKVRGESCSSDHCYFHKAGVPAVFIYTRGKEFSEYHNLNDVPEDLPLTKFTELKDLLINFCLSY